MLQEVGSHKEQWEGCSCGWTWLWVQVRLNVEVRGRGGLPLPCIPDFESPMAADLGAGGAPVIVDASELPP